MERQKVFELVRELFDTEGLAPTRISIIPYKGKVNAAVNGAGEVLLTPEAAAMPERDLRTILLHELGHIVLGHTSVPRYLYAVQSIHAQIEQAADKFAAERVGADVVADMLRRHAPNDDSLKERLAALGAS